MDRLSASYAAKVAIISLTDFYRELDATERALYEQGKFNLDHPSKMLRNNNTACMHAFLKICI